MGVGCYELELAGEKPRIKVGCCTDLATELVTGIFSCIAISPDFYYY
jgi:hypothetical protein